jgi:hypothetical protein
MPRCIALVHSGQHGALARRCAANAFAFSTETRFAAPCWAILKRVNFAMTKKYKPAPPRAQRDPPAADPTLLVAPSLEEFAKGQSGTPRSAGSTLARRQKGKELSRRRRRPRPQKQVRLGDALRQRGLDEHTVADSYVGVIEKLKEKTDKSGGVEKLLVDVLKECSRHLDAPRPDGRAGAGDVPVHVYLIHNVARPERPHLENRE